MRWNVGIERLLAIQGKASSLGNAREVPEKSEKRVTVSRILQ
jgi:hypothetical protein